MQVLVAGAGYAGLGVIKSLEAKLPRDIDITLVDQNEFHLIQHELHRLIRYPELMDDITIPLDEVVDRTEIIQGTIESISPDDASLTLTSGRILEPTILVISLGAVTADWGIPGVKSNTVSMKTVEDALHVHERLADADTRIVVAGAGLSGVQVAGEIAEFQAANGTGPRVTVLEQADRVTPTFPRNFSEQVADALTEIGVVVRNGTEIIRVNDDGVLCADNRTIPAEEVIWTAGITAPAAFNGPRYEVRSDLRLTKRTFALGDAAIVTDNRGTVVPAAAQTAIRQAPIVATNIARLIEADRSETSYVFEPRLERYTHTSPGWVVSIGDKAVAMVGDSVVDGAAAKVLKFSINTGYLGSIGAIDRSVQSVTDKLGWPRTTDC